MLPGIYPEFPYLISSVVGGLTAVVYTEVVQTVILLIGAATLLTVGMWPPCIQTYTIHRDHPRRISEADASVLPRHSGHDRASPLPNRNQG